MGDLKKASIEMSKTEFQKYAARVNAVFDLAKSDVTGSIERETAADASTKFRVISWIPHCIKLINLHYTKVFDKIQWNNSNDVRSACLDTDRGLPFQTFCPTNNKSQLFSSLHKNVRSKYPEE
jgi:hypothetical protein